MTSPKAPYTVLITGASRGLGKALVQHLLQKGTNILVIAAARNVANSKADLEAISRRESNQLRCVQIDSEKQDDPLRAAKELSTQGVSHIDTVISNAAIADGVLPITEVTPETMRQHFEVNAVAPVMLFKAMLPLLSASSNPKFCQIGTGGASIAMIEKVPFPIEPYGASKAALNHLVRKMHFEHEKLTCFILHPGTLKTDMGRAGFEAMGRDVNDLMPVEEAAQNIVNRIRKATRAEVGGKFLDANKDMEWAW